LGSKLPCGGVARQKQKQMVLISFPDMVSKQYKTGIFAMTVPPKPNMKFLCTLTAELERPPSILGNRIIFHVLSGQVDGPELSGIVLRSGGDWMTIRPDGSRALDVRLTIQADEGDLIYCQYFGRMVLPSSMHEMDRSEMHMVDPSLYYFRTAPLYETASEKYSWLNNIQAIGVGRLTATGVANDTFQIL
jgi:hypothetical protein